MDLSTTDIPRGEVFPGGPTISEEPLHRLLQVGNLGGFRPKKSKSGGIAYVVLFSTGTEAEWPDGFDRESGQFRYFGDNRTPGKDLLSGDGNRILDRINALDLDSVSGRRSCPPFPPSVRRRIPRRVRFASKVLPFLHQGIGASESTSE